MRLFGSERMMGMMDALKVDEDTPLDHKMLSSAIEQAQRTVEGRNFQARKSTLEFDDVMNVQRNIIYGERRKVLDGENLRDQIQDMIREYVTGEITHAMGGVHLESQAQLREILSPFRKLFLREGDIQHSAAELKSDELAWRHNQLALETARGNLDLLQKYTYRRDLAKLRSDVRQTEAALDRVRRRAASSILQEESALRPRESEYNRQRQKLDKIMTVIEDLVSSESDSQSGSIDQWLISRLNTHLREIRDVMDRNDLRSMCTVV
jgi:hypothetical protein